MNKVLLISVKPEFAEKILNGTKTVELRKCSPNVNVGDSVIIYSTLPEKAIVGTCIVEQVIKKSPRQLWRTHSRFTGIDKTRYFEYFRFSDIAIGIVLTSISRLEKKLPLDSVRKTLPQFSPPQTFAYLDHRQMIAAGIVDITALG
ncbi:MAG TPA: ASCH domain-containing protein [Ohtaekwangia sp.]